MSVIFWSKIDFVLTKFGDEMFVKSSQHNIFYKNATNIIN